jgi:hypothetical protein
MRPFNHNEQAAVDDRGDRHDCLSADIGGGIVLETGNVATGLSGE